MRCCIKCVIHAEINPVCDYCGGVGYLPLTDRTKEAFLDYLSYDPETGVITWRKPSGFNAKVGREAGFLHRAGYRFISLFRVSYPAHRLAWFLHYGRWPQRWLDHIDGNKSNNRIRNLREADASQNSMNRRGLMSSASGHSNIRATPYGRYRVIVGAYRKRHDLGTYDTLEAAVAARDAGRQRLHGEFARHG
jgi:hypothetical protein